MGKRLIRSPLEINRNWLLKKDACVDGLLVYNEIIGNNTIQIYPEDADDYIFLRNSFAFQGLPHWDWVFSMVYRRKMPLIMEKKYSQLYLTDNIALFRVTRSDISFFYCSATIHKVKLLSSKFHGDISLSIKNGIIFNCFFDAGYFDLLGVKVKHTHFGGLGYSSLNYCHFENSVFMKFHSMKSAYSTYQDTVFYGIKHTHFSNCSFKNCTFQGNLDNVSFSQCGLSASARTKIVEQGGVIYD